MPIHFQDRGAAVRFRVRVQPRASRTELVGEHDGAIRIRLAAPPVDGAANQALRRFLSRLLGVPTSAVAVVAGESSRSKLVEVEGVDSSTARRLLLAAM